MERRHRDLRAWQEAMILVEMVYRLTATFHSDEKFGLTSQMRRSAVSVPANLAEGAARKGTRELLHFISIATASLSELDTHLEIAVRLGYAKDTEELQRKMDQVSMLVSSLAKSLKPKVSRDP